MKRFGLGFRPAPQALRAAENRRASARVPLPLAPGASEAAAPRILSLWGAFSQFMGLFSQLMRLPTLRQLFVEGTPTFCANKSTGERKQGYDHQLVMFNSTYKSKNKEVSGQFPAAILSFSAEPVPHLKIETAYWMHSKKAEALRKGAL